MLSEGSSIRSIDRITGVNRSTIMSLGVRVGTACKKIMDERMRGPVLQEYGAADTKSVERLQCRVCSAEWRIEGRGDFALCALRSQRRVPSGETSTRL